MLVQKELGELCASHFPEIPHAKDLHTSTVSDYGDTGVVGECEAVRNVQINKSGSKGTGYLDVD